MNSKNNHQRKSQPRISGTFLKSAWQITTLLLLLTLVGAPVVAAPLYDEPVPSTCPAPVGDPDSEQPEALIEFRLSNRSAVDELVALGADLAEYLRENDDGSIVVNAFVTPDECALFESLGYQAGATIEDQSTWEAAKAEREVAMAAEQRARDAAEGDVGGSALLMPFRSLNAFDPGGEITVMRVDYFTNYAGRFLSVAAWTSAGLPTGGATMAMAWKEAGGEYGAATNMSKYTDAGQYMYHRVLVRVGALGSTTPVPAMVRVASSTGNSAEAPVNDWLEGSLPPLADGYQKGFFTHYMDPVENMQRINELAAEFPDLAEVINLPYITNGYRRKAMAILSGTGGIGSQPPSSQRPAAVVLFAHAWGHEGGNDIQAEFLNPGAANSPLAVSVTGTRITVSLGTDAAGALASTAAQVVAAINANPAASALVSAYTWAGNAGAGIVQPRALVNLSDFLNAPYPRGPIQNQMIRIGKHRDGSKIGVFIYCQQHSREWTTSITCIETAERLLRNYAIDPMTKEFVDNLDVFIIPNVNPDGAIASYYDNNSQRKSMTNYCPVVSGTSSAGMPSSRNSWGVDLNRNNTVGTVYDGYDGASTSCTSGNYAGPFEGSEPEIKNELWVADTYPNIKFANNIHSFGGYFMWSPGAYKLPGRVTLPAPNIGIEAYFFAGADLVLGRIKEDRQTVILAERTGPIADVLYSAAGNSADDQWYRKGIISYSFETGADIFVSTETGTQQREVGFQPVYEPEGRYEALEFASGNYGLLETAYQYAFDTEPPIAAIVPDGGASQTPIRATFEYVNEPAVIYYTLDGSEPTLASTKWEAQGPRRPGQVFLFEEATSPVTLKWIAQDIKGNVSEVRSARFAVDSVPPSLNPTVTPNPVMLYGVAIAEPNATDPNSGVASASCEAVDTSSVGLKSLTCTATDLAGNSASATVAYNVIYNFSLFTPPVWYPPVPNTVNSGQVIPLKWRIVDANGAPVTNLGSVLVSVVTFPCSLGTTPDLPSETAIGGLQNLGDGYYQFDWKSPKSYAKSCKTLRLDLGEGPGMQRTGLFEFVR